MKNGKFIRVTRVESKGARMEFNSILKELRECLKGHYKFYVLINGSARYNCIIKDSNGEYDLDYKLILTKNCKSNNYPGSPKSIKEDFFSKLQSILEIKSVNRVKYNVENSSSVITIIKNINNKRKYSYDICAL